MIKAKKEVEGKRKKSKKVKPEKGRSATSLDIMLIILEVQIRFTIVAAVHKKLRLSLWTKINTNENLTREKQVI